MKIYPHHVLNYLRKQKNAGTPELELRRQIQALRLYFGFLYQEKIISQEEKNGLINSLRGTPSLSSRTGEVRLEFTSRATFKLLALALIALTVGIIGYTFYSRFFIRTSRPFAYSTTPLTGGRSISFQGRLTDSLGNPITAPIDITYNFYTGPSGGSPISGSTRVCTATPDQDGVFSSLIGNDVGPSCNTQLPPGIFTENTSVYLGVTVGSEPNEMSPRQQIANVGYAMNAETLQGMPPGETTSTVPFINKDGNLLISVSNPGIRSTFASSNFTISSAKTTTIQSANGGDVVLSATDGGALRFNTYYGTLEERMTVLSSGNVGISNLNPSQRLDVVGNATVSGNLTAGGQIQMGRFASAPSQIGAGSLYYDTNVNKVYYSNGVSWIQVGSSDLWQRTLGSLSAINITDDVNIGAVATSSALVHLPGTNNQHAFFNLGTGNVGIGTITPTAGKLQVAGGNVIVDNTYGIDTATAGTLTLGNTTATTVNIGNTAATTIAVGTGALARTITLGNVTGATALNLDTGTGGINLGDNAVTKTIDIGGVTNNAGDSINIATNATTADTITIGNTTAGTTSILRGGSASLIDFSNFDVATTGNVTVAAGQGIDTNGAGILALGNTTATTVNLGGTAATAINIGAGGALTRAIAIGTGTGVDTINIGTGGTGADVITIGSANAGNVTVQSNAALNLTGSTNSLINFPNFDVATTGQISSAYANAAALDLTGNAAGITFSGAGSNTNSINTSNNNHLYVNTGTGNVGIGVASPTSFKLEVAGNIGPEANNTRDLGSSSRYFNTIYVNNIVGSGALGYWNRITGALSPVNTNDVVAATSSATTVATFTTTGTNAAVKAGGATNNLTISADGNLTFANSGTATITGPATGLTIDTATGTLGFGTSNNARTVSIGTGTGVDTINIGTGGTGADVITIGSANAGNVTVQSNAALNLTGSTNSLINFPNFDVATTGNVTVAAGQGIDTNAAGILTLGNTTATTVNIGNTAATTIAVGTGALARTITLGNVTGATALNLDTGTGGINLGDNAVTKTIDIGGVTNNAGDSINIATNATTADTITIGNTTAGTTSILRGGSASLIDFSNFDVATTGNVTVAAGQGIDTNGAGILALGNTTATTVNLGGTAATAINIGAGGALTRAIAIGTGTGVDTINIGTGGTGADDINLGGTSGTTVDIVGATRLGDGGSTNYLQITSGGNISFVGTADTINKVSGTLNINTTNNQAVTTGTGLTTLGGSLQVNGDSTLGNAATDTVTLRGLTTLSDSSATYPLRFGADVDLYRSNTNELSLAAGDSLVVPVSVTSALFTNAGNLDLSATGTNSIDFLTNGSQRWSVLSTGEFEGNGASTIRTSTGNLTLATNGGGGHIILSPNGTGNVGVGTTPSYKLDVSGDINLTGALRAAGNPGGSGQLLSSTVSGLQWIDPTGVGTNYWQRSAGAVTPVVFSDDVNIGNSATSSALVHLPGTNNQHAFFNLGTGNVGIGTITPTAGKLQVAGGNVIVDNTYGIDTATAGTLTLGNTTATTVNIGNTAATTIAVGTGALARTITLGNVTGATAVNINTGTGGSTYTTTNGAFALNTGTGSIGLGTDAVAKILTIGNVTGATAVNINAGTGGSTYTTTNSTFALNTGTGAINLGTDATAKTITMGNVTGATAVNINTGTGGSTYTTTNGAFSLNTGTGAINLGTDAVAKTLTLGNVTGATALNLDTGTGGINLGDNAVTKTIDIGGVTNNAGDSINIATNATTADTITIGNTTAGTTSILRGGSASLIDFSNFDVATTGNVTVAAGQGIDTNGAGILALGNTTATTVNLGGTAATAINIGAGGALTRAIAIGTGTGVDTINIGTGGTGADVIRLGSSVADLELTDAQWSITTAGAFNGVTGVFGTSVTSPSYTGTGAVTVSSGGTSDLTLDSASGTIRTASGDSLLVDKYATVSGSLAVGYSSVLSGTGNGAFSGNVGIGTTAPNYRLELSAGTGIVARFSGRVIGLSAVNSDEFVTLAQLTGGVGQYWQRNSGSLAQSNITDDVNIGAVATSSALVHLPGTNNQHAFFNLGTGNVGIGTITPTAGKLQVAGGNVIVDNTYGIDTATAGTLTLGNTTATTVNIGNTAATTIAVGTGALARTITLGNVTGATALNLDTGTGGINLGDNAVTKTIDIGGVTNNAGDSINIATNATTADTITIGNTTAGTTSILRGGSASLIDFSNFDVATTGNVTVAAGQGIDTNGAGILALGNTTATTVNLGGTAATAINIGAGGALTRAIAIGTGTGVDTINIGTGGTGADVITIGSANAGAVTLSGGTNSAIDFPNFDVATTGNITVASTYGIDANSAGGTLAIGNVNAGTLNIGGRATATTVAIGNGVGGNTITIGNGVNTSAQTVSIANGASGADSTVSILSGAGTAGTGSLALGNNARVTTIGIGNVAPAVARTITIAGGNSAQNDTVNILAGNPSANTQTVNILSGAATGGTQNLNLGTGASAKSISVGNTTGGTSIAMNVGTGNFSLNGVAGSTYTLGAATTTGTIAIGGTAQTGTITLGSSSGTNSVGIGIGEGATTVNIATGATNGKTINIGSGSIANTITLGNSIGATSISLNTGTGSSLNLGTNAVAHTVTIGNATGATALALNSGSGDVTLTSTDQIVLSSSKTAGGTTAEAISLKSTIDLGASDEVFQIGDSLLDMLTVRGDGNVGIGTVTPSYKLDVSGDINLSGALRASGDPGLSGQILSSTATGIQWISSSALNYWQRTLGSLAPLNITDDINIGDTATSSALIHLPGTTGNNAWFNLGMGNLGIGVTTPSTFKLEIAGSIGPSGNLIYDLGSASKAWNSIYAGTLYQGGTQISDLFVQLQSSSPGTQQTGHLNISGRGMFGSDLSVGGYATVAASLAVGTYNAPGGPGNAVFSGNIGVGTNNPSYRLDVVGALRTTAESYMFRGSYSDPSVGLNAALKIDDLLAADGVRINSGGLSIGATYYSSAPPTSGMIIEGNMGIGKVTPTEKLDVTGNASMSGNLTIGNNSAIQSAFGPLNLAYKSAPDLWATGLTLQNGSGNVGIGTTVPSSFKLQMGGNVGPSLTNTYNLGSSALSWNNVYAQAYYVNGVNIDDFYIKLQSSSPGTQQTGHLNISGRGMFGSDLSVGGYATVAASLAVGYNTTPGGIGNAVFSGNVGIGTSTPQYSVDVGVNGALKRIGGYSDSTHFGYYLPYDGGTGYSVFNHYWLSGTGGYQFQENGSSLVTIQQAGNVGIGTETPLAMLDVRGDATLSGSLTVGQSGTLKTAYGPLTLQYKSGPNTWTHALTIRDISGNIGIGTATPIGLLQVALGSNQLAVLNNGSAASGVTMTNGSILSQSSQFQIAGVGSNPISIYTGATINSMTAGTERVQFGTDGGVVIGSQGGFGIGYDNAGEDNLLVAGTATIGIDAEPSTTLTIENNIRAIRYEGHGGIYYVVPGADSLLGGKLGIEDGLELRDGGFSTSRQISFWNSSDQQIASMGALSNGIVYVAGNDATDLCVGNPNTLPAGSPVCDGKIDAGTIDPPYTINGKKYATYMSAMTGVKEETTGHVIVSQKNTQGIYEYNIDFDNQPEASDLWLFSKTTSLRKQIRSMAVLLTPSDNTRAWYKVDPSTFRLTLYSSRPTTISYRLTAPRFDADKWANANPDGSHGFIINDPDVIKSPATTLTQNGTVDPLTLPIIHKETDTLISLSQATATEPLIDRLAYTLQDSMGNTIGEVGEFASVTIAQATAGLIQTNELVVRSVLAVRNILAVSIETIDLVAQNIVVREKIVSPVIETNELSAQKNITAPTIETDSITSLSENLTFDLAPKSKTTSGLSKLIIEGLDGKTAATIDAAGNASFAGTLTAENASISGSLTATNASISGTLIAENIESKTINALSSRIDNLSSATGSGVVAKDISEQINTIQRELAQISSHTLLNPQESPLTTVGEQDIVSTDKLSVLSQADVYRISVAQSAVVGNLYMEDGSLISLSSTLQLSALASINFFDGSVTISRKGDIVANGTIAASGLSVRNESGTETARIDASGSALFKQITTEGLSIARSSSNSAAIIQDSGIRDDRGFPLPAIDSGKESAGEAYLPSTADEIIIYNMHVNPQSLIYLTPVGNNQISAPLSISRTYSCPVNRQDCRSYFGVSLGGVSHENLRFNWLIVN